MTEYAWKPDVFEAALGEAVDTAQVGFHFEEGGCWGMAAALYEQMTCLGLAVEMQYRDGDFVHAWTSVSGQCFDHQGLMRHQPCWKAISTVAEMEKLANLNGIDMEQFHADRAQASEIVAQAIEKLKC